MSFATLTPKMKPLTARKSKIVCVLDIGSSKIACMIAKLKPADPSEVLPSRSHKVDVLGFGHAQSAGIKSGVVVNGDEAEKAIRRAVADAESQANEQVESVILAISAGRIAGASWQAAIELTGSRVEESDIYRLMEIASNHDLQEGRSLLHSLPSTYSLDNAQGITEPRGMIGKNLGVEMHIISTDSLIARNLMLLIERCHLNVEAIVASPFASGLSVLTDDEAEIGTVCLDFGAGTTTFAVFAGGRLIDAGGISVGGKHITSDIARGLSISFDDAERLKVLHGGVIATKSDEREMYRVKSIGQEDYDLPHSVSRAQLIDIIRPRIDEILELVLKRLEEMPILGESDKRVVITGGGSLLTGLADFTGQILQRHVRLGRPMGVTGLPAIAKSPAFSTLTGLAIYPQFAGLEHYELTAPQELMGKSGLLSTRLRKTWGWIKESF
jgi:cell division protein FtsA